MRLRVTRGLNRTQPSNLQLCSNQSTNHNSWFGVRETTRILLPRVSIFCRSAIIAQGLISLFKSTYTFKRHFLAKNPNFSVIGLVLKPDLFFSLNLNSVSVLIRTSVTHFNISQSYVFVFDI